MSNFSALSCRFSKRIEVGVSIYKVGGELSARGMNRALQVQVGESPRGGFEILNCRRCILSIFCHWILLKCLVLCTAFFFVKYTKMLYQWQLVKNKVIQSNFPGNFHDKSSLRISLLPKELKNVVIYNYK